jgi:hypothetical protein
MTTWRDVPTWSTGGNDLHNDCSVVAAFANWRDLWQTLLGRDTTPVSEVECLAEYRRLTGFDAYHPLDDRGVFLNSVLDDMVVNGCFGDPLWKPSAYHEIALEQVPAALVAYRALPMWVNLPIDGNDDPVFADDPYQVARTAPHAVLLVEWSDMATFITWAQPQAVSLAWLARFFGQAFAVERPIFDA